MGVVDELAEEGKLREGALAFARRLIAGNAPLKKVRDRTDKLEPRARPPGDLRGDPQGQRPQVPRLRGLGEGDRVGRNGGRPAVRRGHGQSERELFMALLATTQSKAQRYVFFAERQAAKIADIGPDAPARPIRSVGVIGAGTMGGGIAMNFL